MVAGVLIPAGPQPRTPPAARAASATAGDAYNSPRDFFNGRPALPVSGGKVTAIAPTIDWDKGTYTIPTQTGVIYLVDGAVKAAGTHHARSTTLTITAKAAATYSLTTTPSWSYDLSFLALTATAPTFNKT